MVSGPSRLGEFELIARYFAPLAADNPGALGLVDDAALLSASPGTEMVATVDMLVAGVHFLAGDPPDLVARKLLRVNLSDLAAMGAEPRCYLLAISLPANTDEPWLTAFADGLAADQREFGVRLAGGDTTATPGPMTLCLTALGEVPVGRAIRRSTARIGDDLYVSGTIGDAALAVALWAGDPQRKLAPEFDELVDRYRLPRPRVRLGPAVRDIATAAIDVSDGLIADLSHICESSGVGAEVDAARVPLSPAAEAALGDDPARLDAVLGGGDDYELLFTADPAAGDAVAEAGRSAGIAVHRIGQIVAGAGVSVRDAKGKEIHLKTKGYKHF